MVRRRTRTDRLEKPVDRNNSSRSMSSLCNIPKHPSTNTEGTLKRTIDHFYLSEGHRYRASGPIEYLPTGRPGEVVIYQDSLKAGLRFPLHPFLVEFFCTFNLSPGQLVPNALRMLNYYLLVCVRHDVEPSVDVFRLLFEMKLLDRYDCYVVFSHRDRGLPSHDHFKIPNCPSSNSGWKNRYFFVKPVAGNFPFPLDWGVPHLEEFNSTPILSEQEIDSLIILRATEPLSQSMTIRSSLASNSSLICPTTSWESLCTLIDRAPIFNAYCFINMIPAPDPSLLEDPSTNSVQSGFLPDINLSDNSAMKSART
ncbi:Uncharacterized protein Adt_05789 [Abeliophyllum distichum]|uniref:Transposase (putative) gypsy type domain-containing protein n=1 Tax=Abeliophyllum distichum TaxID=126358 RepID=A0ABD1V552_9LAMI